MGLGLVNTHDGVCMHRFAPVKAVSIAGDSSHLRSAALPSKESGRDNLGLHTVQLLPVIITGERLGVISDLGQLG